VPDVDSVSGLSILDCPLGFLKHLFLTGWWQLINSIKF
jgi:hypothetical protein